MKLPSLTDAPIAGKRVLVRVDFNVSLKDDQTITNDNRIREAIPTISYLLKKNATPILLSHLGRPKSKNDKSCSLNCVAKRLKELINRDVVFITEYWKPDVIRRIRQLPPGTLVLCENVRFYPGEERNEVWFSRQLASLAQLYVNDAFGTAHRTHASTVGVSALLPSYAGFLLNREVTMIGSAMTRPKRPLLVVIGGGKTPEKIRVIEKLLDIADTIYLGGAVANTFFATWGISVGVSRVDHEMIEMARARGITVLLAGMEAPTNAGPEYRQQVHEAYQELEKKYDVIFVPFVLKDLVGSEKLIQQDGTHPTAQGARRIAETVYERLKPLVAAD